MRILWTSDHHTLHQTTPTTHVLGNMSTFYFKDHDLNNIDLSIFGGDLTERMVEAPNPDFIKLKEWAKVYLNACDKAHTAALVLEGTHSHDRGQPKHLETLAPEGMDFRYVDTLSIQYYPQFNNLSILCVPDNMGTLTPDEIWDKTVALLNEHKLKQVDLIVFHGAWEHQLPVQVRHKAHQLDRWETIVKYFILSGHIHVPSEVGKMRCSGSFDRTAHGEEHPKGGYLVELDLEKEIATSTFQENKNALPYLTLKVKEDITTEQLVLDLQQFIRRKKLPYHSQIRVMGGAADIVKPVIRIFEKEFPYFGFKAENAKAKEQHVQDDLFNNQTYDYPQLTKKNLASALLPECQGVFEKEGISDEEALKVLEEFL